MAVSHRHRHRIRLITHRVQSGTLSADPAWPQSRARIRRYKDSPMNRLVSTVGTLAAAVLLAVSLPASAYAATGWLIVNGVPHRNPQRGCYGASSPIAVDNFTNATVLVHAASDCQGPVTAAIGPSEIDTAFGNSYFVL